VSLCRRHHRLVHEGGYTVRRLDDGVFVFRAPDGRPICPERVDHVEVVARSSLDPARPIAGDR